MVNIAHIPLQLDRLFAHQFKSSVLRRVDAARNTRDRVDRFVLGKERKLEVGSHLLLGPPIVQSMYLTIDVVFNAGKIGHVLLFWCVLTITLW